MRTVNYKVRMENGFDFTTTNYAEATGTGNRIIKTFLTEPDQTPKEYLEKMSKHRERIRNKFNF